MTNLKRLRLKKKLTQEQVADLAGVRRTHVSHIETGRIANPRADLTLKIARALGVSVEELLGKRTRGAA